jgi:hypothetical protein
MKGRGFWDVGWQGPIRDEFRLIMSSAAGLPGAATRSPAAQVIRTERRAPLTGKIENGGAAPRYLSRRAQFRDDRSVVGSIRFWIPPSDGRYFGPERRGSDTRSPTCDPCAHL